MTLGLLFGACLLAGDEKAKGKGQEGVPGTASAAVEGKTSDAAKPETSKSGTERPIEPSPVPVPKGSIATPPPETAPVAPSGSKDAEAAKPGEGEAAKPDEAGNAEKAKPAKAAVVDPNAYIIGAEDVLVIRVWREPELSGQLPVRPDGKISLQLVNEVQAAGLTPEQLGATIAEGLAKVMTRPEVSVSVLQVNSKKYFISGEVQRPGAYPLLIPTTVVEALVNGGGFREFANQKDIVIVRGKERFKFNYKDFAKGKGSDKNIMLQHGDHILVR